jgi:hypothetical protein
VRFALGCLSVIVLGYRVEDSIIVAPLDAMDTLYCGFYGSIILYCLKEGIIPEEESPEYQLEVK